MPSQCYRLILIVGLFLLAACGATSAGPGDALAGQRLFAGETPIAGGNAPTCISCHPVAPAEPPQIGPNLSNVGARAGTTIAGMAPEMYLRASIVDPDAYLVESFQEGIHFRGYGQALTPQQLNDLIAYLLTLKSGQD